ncbi:hypothetical protein J6590_036190 [Homalodisca vitripennis]|nr:hypothetical protein J6590_036190 [Homalodisca vitripennis]
MLTNPRNISREPRTPAVRGDAQKHVHGRGDRALRPPFFLGYTETQWEHLLRGVREKRRLMEEFQMEDMFVAPKQIDSGRASILINMYRWSLLACDHLALWTHNNVTSARILIELSSKEMSGNRYYYKSSSGMPTLVLSP